MAPSLGTDIDIYSVLLEIFETLLTVFTVAIFVVLIVATIYAIKFMGIFPFKNKFPITLIVLREIGETMPEPMVMKARIKAFQVDEKEMDIQENWLETDKYDGKTYLFPIFENARNISDKLRIYYMKGKSTSHNFKGNVYPTLITKYGIKKVSKFIFGRDIEIPVGMTKDEQITLTDEMGVVEKAIITKVKNDDGEFPAIASEFRYVTFPTSVNLNPLYDESAIPTYYRMHKTNAQRYDWRDWFQKYGAIVMFSITAVIIFIMGIVIIKYGEALKEGVKVAVTLHLENTDLQQIPTPTPPAETPPAR
jgi:hypothetical protein